MPFKIVQSIEKGNIVLSCVPQEWERGGILYWPRKQQYKLQRDERSEPDETWQQFNCILKRQNIKSYRDGINEIDIMSNDSETDDNYTSEVVKKARKCVEIPQQSFNILAEEYLISNKQTYHTLPETENATPSQIIISQEIENNNQAYQTIPEAENAAPSQIVISQEIEASSQLHMETVDLKTMQEDIKTIKEMQHTLNSNQIVLHETLNTALLKITEIQVQFEKFIKKSITEKKNNEVGLEPIKNLLDLKEFEKRLDDPKFNQDMQRKLSALCTKGTGQGTTNSYSIIDLIFERNFLKSCSWTGVSRLQNTTSTSKDPAGPNLQAQEKICFKSFSKTINFFFDIIHKSDETFTFPACQKFFKTILRNASVRCKEFQQRASTKKIRQTKKKHNISSENIPKEPIPSTSRQPLAEQQINILPDEVNNFSAEEA